LLVKTEMAHKNGQVKGKLAYREGDGVDRLIPARPCEIEITGLDVTLSWVDCKTLGATAIPLADDHQHVMEGLLVVA